jgi:putative pyruvate formate lyase activating enzyme
MCPRRCNIDRTGLQQTGVCKTLEKAWVSSFHPHFGEEAPLVGMHGSGTIFFTHCNLLCNFCQNYDISHQGVGQEVTDAQLAAMMLSLQNEGCHNINFVTPSHVVPPILSALEMACAQGLTIPLVYNSGGYDRVETLKLLDGVFDIYMPDFKFWDSGIAEMVCNAPDYAEVTRKAIREMYHQVGDLVFDARGIAQRGLLVRHLVLPEGKADTREIMRYISREISTNTYVNIMSQYRPCGSVTGIKALERSVSRREFMDALHAARAEGLTRLD